jgi:hypothetical protein
MKIVALCSLDIYNNFEWASTALFLYVRLVFNFISSYEVMQLTILPVQ